jgi:hypothetical protein
MKVLFLLLISVSCGYQAPVTIQKGPGIISGVSVTDDVLDNVVLETDKIDSDYLDAYLSGIVVQTVDPVSGSADSRVHYRRLSELYAKDSDFRATRLKLYKFYRDVTLTALSREQLHATHINAYNFFTLETVLLNYAGGTLRSISDIGGEGSFRAFKEIFYPLGGELLSLDQIENERLRPSMNFADGRVHFALICASIGCPVLLHKAYRGETLDAQLDDVTRIGLRLPRMLDLRNGELKLSQIFDWFLDDFVNQSGSIEAFLRTYANDLPAPLPALDYVDYDWGLNDAP